MRIRSILVVCLGNVCRSPLGAALLARELPGMVVASAGLAAAPGAPADIEAERFAQALDLDLGAHRSRRIDGEMVRAADVILAMDAGLRDAVRTRWPHVSGKTLLFGHWLEGVDIADPVGQEPSFHQTSYSLLASAALAWAARLKAFE